MEVRWHLWHLFTNYHHIIVGWRLGHSLVCYGMLLRITDGGKTDSSPNLCSSTALETSNAEENQNGGFSLLLFVLKPRHALIIYWCSLFHHRKVHILMSSRSHRPIKVICTHFRMMFMCQYKCDLCIKFQNLHFKITGIEWYMLHC